MKTLFKLFLVAVIVVVVAVFYYSDRNPHAKKASDDLKNAASEAKDFVEDKLNLTPETIKAELAKTGQVVREKTHSAVSNPAVNDAKITTEVKARLAADSALSVLNISVSTSDGVVTLSGTSSSPENIKKAIQTTMDTEGVKKVVSTLQVKE